MFVLLPGFGRILRGVINMDSVLKELKEIREETESSLTELIDRLETVNLDVFNKLRDLSAGDKENGDGVGSRDLLILLQEMHSNNREVTQAIRKAISLNNARSAELARQLTVLPLERMDLVLDKFEARLESLEAELNRLKK
jgi:hypothetical protein